MSAAGEMGFLNLLPVFVDHILFPKLSETSFVTEVFHIDGDGKDAGVVYSEMQGRQNSAYDIAHRAYVQLSFNEVALFGSNLSFRYRQALYPSGSGYRSETGGLMKALRILDIAQIRKYHSEYYLPNNICIVVTGKISTERLLNEITEKIERSIERHGNIFETVQSDWKRPFVGTNSSLVPRIPENQTITYEFPSMETSLGEFKMIMIGPSLHDQLNLMVGILSIVETIY